MTNILELYSEDTLLENIDNERIDIDAEVEDEVESTTSSRKLYIDKVDKSTSDLIRMIKEGELILQPDYQRKFVWNQKTMSQFIESLLLSIPIPTIFLSENDDDTLEVIDGQQRLTTVFTFFKSILNEDDLKNVKKGNEYLNYMEPLELSGLSTLSDFNKKTFAELDDRIQRKFKNVSLPIVIIQKDSSEDIKYDIFSRINQGSIKLNGQELLNVMYRGVFLTKLNETCELDIVDEIFGKRVVLKKRYGYNEILLRAFVINEFIDESFTAIKKIEVRNPKLLDGKKERTYGGRLNTAIIEFLKEYRNDVKKSEELEDFILKSIEKVNIVFGNDAFKRISSNELATSINKTVAETQLVILSRFSIDEVKQYKEKIKESFLEFLGKSDEGLFVRGTNNTSNVLKRYEWGKFLNKLIRN
ncbi:hypothetical protein TZ94_00482 [Streptococcus infantis]|uniref:GmrSD restriction endonucleases N-terminal domain-containing protein n=1 Tax=Streptococcus infantis TaxID=68892 RepID=A0A0F2E3U7_9STRE|nr:DUF262 domain-containing protein [Streptococcus infantis]KJQ77897.1 hypothetical protein TZ94_00482 [Streptococcus infantis]